MADFTNPNAAENVSTTRGVVGGYFLRAAVDVTDLPTAENFSTWVPTDAWTNLGYIPEDGFTEGVEFADTTELRDINLDVVDSSTGAATETLTVTLMEMNARALAAEFGTANVTDAKGVITVNHDWSKLNEEYAYVMRLVLKNGRKWVKFIPKGKVTSVGEFTGNATTAAQRQIVLSYIKPDEGAACVDFMESNDTTPTI